MSECYCCQDMRRPDEMPIHIDGVCIWCQFACEKRKIENLQAEVEKLEARLKPLLKFEHATLVSVKHGGDE